MAAETMRASSMCAACSVGEVEAAAEAATIANTIFSFIILPWFRSSFYSPFGGFFVRQDSHIATRVPVPLAKGEAGPAVAASAIPEAPGALACRDSLRAPPTKSAINPAFSYLRLASVLQPTNIWVDRTPPGCQDWFSFIP